MVSFLEVWLCITQVLQLDSVLDIGPASSVIVSWAANLWILGSMPAAGNGTLQLTLDSCFHSSFASLLLYWLPVYYALSCAKLTLKLSHPAIQFLTQRKANLCLVQRLKKVWFMA